MLVVEKLATALEQEAQTAALEAAHICEWNPLPGSSAWWLAAFKLVLAESLLRVASAVREAGEA